MLTRLTLLLAPPVDHLLNLWRISIQMQLLTYHIAAHCGLDVDQPLNLVKIVTLE